MHCDCIAGMQTLPAGSVDLVFADPPFNIGYEYDSYDDSKTANEYCEWSRRWMSEVVRILKPNGTFWLAIGDEYAAELKVIATRDLGLTCRNWVIWYYTFGVHCNSKFTRSHAHLLYFVRNPNDFKFNDAVIRVPSARQLVYADKRANPRGRVPDDTWVIRPTPEASWILRPQDLPEGFSADSDTWYVPRICGTFRERAGFHGCQMPEQVLGRIIKVSSNPGELVLDPFVGSGTTVVVAKKLNRAYIGFDISAEYVAQARKRVASDNVGDQLSGSDNPLETVPSTRQRASRTAENGGKVNAPSRGPTRTKGFDDVSNQLVRAFLDAHCGFSLDRALADPVINRNFLAACERHSIPGSPADWNRKLLQLRKANRLRLPHRVRRTLVDPTYLAHCEVASEIALAQIRHAYEVSLDAILCDPELATQFDELARRVVPGFEPLCYRWAALGLRKRAKDARDAAILGEQKWGHRRFRPAVGVYKLSPELIDDDAPSVFAFRREQSDFYIGYSASIRESIVLWGNGGTLKVICEFAQSELQFAYSPVGDVLVRDRQGMQSYLIGRRKPKWNYPELTPRVA